MADEIIQKTFDINKLPEGIETMAELIEELNKRLVDIEEALSEIYRQRRSAP